MSGLEPLGIHAACQRVRKFIAIDRLDEVDVEARAVSAFAVLWHPDRFDALTSGGWDRLYSRVLAGVLERGGSCMSAGELSSHSTWSK